MHDILKTVIPLYYRAVDEAIGVPSSVTLDVAPEEDAVLITRETFPDLADLLSDHGTPRFHVFDMPAEARAACAMLGSGTEVGVLRDGEGVLAVFNEDLPIDDDGFEIRDFRSHSCRQVEIFGSWELTAAECEALMRRPEEAHRMDLANAIAGKIAELPNPDVLRDLQVALEKIPGAYVGFVSVSPSEIRGDPRLDGIEAAEIDDAEIQSAVVKASSKAEMGDAYGEAVDIAVERLMAHHPALFDRLSGEEIEP